MRVYGKGSLGTEYPDPCYPVGTNNRTMLPEPIILGILTAMLDAFAKYKESEIGLFGPTPDSRHWVLAQTMFRLYCQPQVRAMIEPDSDMQQRLHDVFERCADIYEWVKTGEEMVRLGHRMKRNYHKHQYQRLPITIRQWFLMRAEHMAGQLSDDGTGEWYANNYSVKGHLNDMRWTREHHDDDGDLDETDDEIDEIDDGVDIEIIQEIHYN